MMTLASALCLPAAMIALMTPFQADTQEVNAQIEIGPNIRISSTQPDFPHVEPHVAVNPKDPKNLVAASMVVHDVEGLVEIHCVAFASFDGGRTWTVTDLNKLLNPSLYNTRGPGAKICADVWVAFDNNGAAYVSGLGRPQPDAPRLNGVVFRSPDGGKTWLKPTSVPAGKGRSYDQEDIIVDTTDSPFSGTLYYSAVQGGVPSPQGPKLQAIAVARSTDGGKTFSELVQVFPSNLAVQEMNMAVLSDGTLVVSYTDYMSRGPSPYLRWRVERPRLWILSSTDGGQTFSPPLFVAEKRQRQIPKIAADVYSEPFRDYLYAAWADWGKTNDPDVPVYFNPEKGVYFVRSTNKGYLWSKPVRIDNAPKADTMRGTAAIAVNREGVVGVAWYDRRNDPKNECQDIYFMASLDGGETFLPEVRVSTELSCPNVPGNGAAGGRWPMGGEYSGLVADADGKFHVAWSDARTGVYQLWIATATVHGKVSKRDSDPRKSEAE